MNKQEVVSRLRQTGASFDVNAPKAELEKILQQTLEDFADSEITDPEEKAFVEDTKDKKKIKNTADLASADINLKETKPELKKVVKKVDDRDEHYKKMGLKMIRNTEKVDELKAQKKLAGITREGYPLVKLCALFFMTFFLSASLFAGTFDDTKTIVTYDGMSIGLYGDVNGNVIPRVDDSYNIGSASYQVGSVYATALYLNGVGVTSWGSVISPWTDTGSALYMTGYGASVLSITSSGTIQSTGNADFYTYIMKNDAVFANETNNTVTLTENSDIFSVVFDGDDIRLDSSDGSIELYPQADATEGTVEFLTGGDTNDYLQVKTTSNEPYITTVGSCDLNINSSSGEIDMGDDNLTTTGTLDSGATTVTSLIIGDDTLDVVVDDYLRFYSNDNNSYIEALGYEAKEAGLILTADQGDDNSDQGAIVVDTSGNMLFKNDTSGTLSTILTLAPTGVLTTTSTASIISDDTTDGVVNGLTIRHSSSDNNATAADGAGISFQLENATGTSTVEEWASIDTVSSTITNGSEDGDLKFNLMSAGAVAEVGKFVGASSATVSDYFLVEGNTTETNGVVDVLKLQAKTGTAADGFGEGIAFILEDNDGDADEFASIDVVATDVTDATEDGDIIFRQILAGTVTDTLTLDASAYKAIFNALNVNILDDYTLQLGTSVEWQHEYDDGTDDQYLIKSTKVGTAATTDPMVEILVDTGHANGTSMTANQQVFGVAKGTQGSNVALFTVDEDGDTETAGTAQIDGVVTVGDAGAEDQTVVFDGSAQDYHIGLDDTDDDLKIGLGSAVGTTPAITIAETQVVTFPKTVVFSGGQTRKLVILPEDVTLDGTSPAAIAQIGTDGQAVFDVLTFDADGGSTGDDIAYYSWVVPPGYVTDSARLNVYYSFSDAEDAADEAQFDFAVNAVAAGETMDAAGTALADQTTVVSDASADNGKLHKTQYNIEVEDIVIGDLVTIEIAVDESASALSASGTLDVSYFEIEYESTE